MAHRDPLIKDEALPLPQTVFSGDLFEVLQDATLKVVHLFHPGLLEVRRGFFTADPAGAEHGDLGLLAGIDVGFTPSGQLAEGANVRIHGVLERPDFHFVVVAGVHQDDVRVGQQRVPIFWRNVRAHQPGRVHAGDPHGDDLFLQPNPKLAKRVPVR